MSSNPQKIIVTGGSGFIGSNLVEELRTQGYDVESITSAENDIRDTELLKERFAGAHIVFHLAGLSRVKDALDRPLESHEVNVTGTLSVLEAARHAGVKRVVFASSSAVYGPQNDLPFRENMSVRPEHPYALQKYIGEMYCKLYSELFGLETVCLRYCNVYGSEDAFKNRGTTVISHFLTLQKEGNPLTIAGNGEQKLDFVHVRDVTRANVLAAKSELVGKGEIINIGSGENTSILELAELIGGHVEFMEVQTDQQSTLADITLAKKLLDWEPQISLEEGIAELKIV